VSGRFDAQSTQILVQAWQRQASADEALYFLGRPPSSASFYSAGQARALADLADLPPGRSAWVVLSRPALAALAPAQRERLSPVAEQDARVLMRWR
jgi:hypothetical protein